jgi:hypothetical protein
MIYWDQSEISALGSVFTTVSIATQGKTESNLRAELEAKNIHVVEEPLGYHLYNYSEKIKDKILCARFISHVLIFPWGYEVNIFINLATKKNRWY